MAITKSRAADRAGSTEYSRTKCVSRNLELFLLLLITAVLGTGLWLALSAQLQGMNGNVFNLNEAADSKDLAPVVTLFDDPRERSLAAASIMTYLRDHAPIESVGDLRKVRATRKQIAGLRMKGVLKDRLDKAGAEEDSIPLLTAAQIRQLRPLVCVRNKANFLHSVYFYGALFFVAFYALHVAWRMRAFFGDQLLLPAVHFLSGLGFIMMLRLRDPLREGLLFPDFAVGAAIGCALAFLASMPDYERSPLKRLAYVPLLLSFALSTALILFGSGPGLSDAKVNLQLGPMQFQPVEIIKLLLLFFLAGYFADHWEFLRSLRQAPETLPGILRGFQMPKLRYALPLVIAAVVAIVFFFLEKDMGPALVMLLLFLIIYATARSRFAGALVSCACLVAAIWIGYTLKVPHTVAARLSMWLSPWDNYIHSGGDHLAQSLWSFSSGGMFGTGLGMGNPAIVPAAHTDLILAAIGEELGFIGLICVWAAYVVLVHRALRISMRGGGAYSIFLGFSAALLIALQAIFISAGILGIVPLSGVVTPFVNYGKTSAISSFLILGMLASISKNGKTDPSQNEPFRKPMAAIGTLLAVFAVPVVLQAARVQIFEADKVLGRGALIFQADGHRRYAYNPRILEAAHSIPRGTIFDRNGLPLAASSASLLESYRTQYNQANIDLDKIATPGEKRYYPFGPLTFHLLGDLRTRLNWGASNSTYTERDSNVVLQGYDDHAEVVRVQDEMDGPERLVVRRDFREIVPLVRYRYKPDQKQVQEILNRNRDVHLTVDARLQARVAAILEKRILASKTQAGAAIVIDPSTGDILASVSYPLADQEKAKRTIESDEILDAQAFQNSLLDRARYGVYPPGSSFKLVTAIAAMQSLRDADPKSFECKRLPDGRIGNYVKGWGRPIRDDVLDKEPHGKVDLAQGLIHSCNAFFAQLGAYVVGSERLLKTADLFGIRVASPNTAAQLRDALAQASYGQGQVVATPLQMVRVAAAISNKGLVPFTKISKDEAAAASQTCMTEKQALELASYMRRVVTEGTGREASGSAIPIAGKTGTAEVEKKPAHAWFVGFAPYGSNSKKIAFAVLVENGRYGGKIAAPAAAEIIDAAAELGLLRER
jgi:cell division protein FtsI/penicillin-binding protein 2/cell division protein FtsW (lipid II flippase)